MPTRFIQRRASLAPNDVSLANANAIFVDSDDDQLKFTTGASGTTTVDIVTESQTQTLTNKTLTNPLVTNAIIAGGSALTIVATTHAGKTIALDTAAGTTITLPAATATGNIYNFLVTVTATSNSHIIQVANATDEMRGYVIQDASEATAPNIFWAADNDDTITLNRTTTGLAAQGEYFTLIDAVSGVFFVQGYSQANGIEATPFSNAVS